MGKGDKRSRKGKIVTGSYGKNRAHKAKNIASRLDNPANAKAAKAAKKKK